MIWHWVTVERLALERSKGGSHLSAGAALQGGMLGALRLEALAHIILVPLQLLLDAFQRIRQPTPLSPHLLSQTSFNASLALRVQPFLSPYLHIQKNVTDQKRHKQRAAC